MIYMIDNEKSYEWMIQGLTNALRIAPFAL